MLLAQIQTVLLLVLVIPALPEMVSHAQMTTNVQQELQIVMLMLPVPTLLVLSHVHAMPVSPEME
jgi:hypothetical protein